MPDYIPDMVDLYNEYDRRRYDCYNDEEEDDTETLEIIEEEEG